MDLLVGQAWEEPGSRSPNDADTPNPAILPQLGMGQAQGPETQVGGCVGDAAQAELNGVDCLVHEDLRRDKLHGKRS